MIQQFHFWAYNRTKWNHSLDEVSAPHVHCRIIYNSQDTEAIYISIDARMDKEMWYTHNRILFSHKRRKFYHLQQHGWNLRTLCLVKRVQNKKTRMISLMWNVKNKRTWGFSGGSVVKNLPASAGDTGSVLDLGRSHMPRSNWAVRHSGWAGARERRSRNCWARVSWSPCSAMRAATSEESVHSN